MNVSQETWAEPKPFTIFLEGGQEVFMKRFILFFLLAVFFCSSLLVLSSVKRTLAQSGDEVAHELEEVVVTASRVKEKKRELTSNVIVIDEEEIKNSSARDFGDLLAEKGIGHIHKYPGTSTSIGIRGFRTDCTGNDLMGHVLILLNGRRADTGNLAKIMTKNIERVEIIRGPASVQYGSAAMGGVVNVITKQGKDKPTVFVEGILGSFGHEEGSIGFSGKVKRFDFSGSFTTESRKDYDTADGEKYYNTGYDKENSSLNFGYEFLPGNRIGVIYNRFDADDVGMPSYLNQNDLDDYGEKSNESIDFIYEGRSPKTLFSWMVRYFDGEDKDKSFDPTGSNPDFYDDGIPSKRKIDQKGTQAQVSLNRENSLVTAGFDWVNYEIESRPYAPNKTEYDNPSYFLLAKTRLFDDRFIISGGLRYDEYEVEVKEPAGRTEDDDNLSPRFGLAYLLIDYLKIRANYGEAFVMPAAEQMAGDYDAGWGMRYTGNPDLDPEESKTYEGGLDFSYASFNSALTYFYTDFEDKIEAVSKPGGISTWENVGKATVQGLEGDFSCDIGTLFEWKFEVKPYVSFVYLTEYEDRETGKDLKYTSDLHVSYGITISDLKGFSANLNFAYTGEQSVDDWESGLWPAPVVEEGGFTVANFTISKKILDYEKYGGLTLIGEIQNLLDKDYKYAKGYPMPGRSFFLGLRYDF